MEFKCILSAKVAGILKRTPTKMNFSSVSTQEGEEPAMEPTIVKEGWLRKRSGCIKTWRNRYFVLRDDGSLLGFKTRPGAGVYSGTPSTFTVRACQVVMKESAKRFAFILRFLRGDKNIERTFSAISPNERMEWLEAIKFVDEVLDKDASMSERAPALKCRKQAGTITFKDFELIRTLGRGSFGKVVLAQERSSEQLCAIKIIRKKTVSTDARAARTMAENRVLRSTDHPFLIALKCSFQTPDRLCFVMEYANGGELLFHYSTELVFSEEKTRFYGAEILLALEYLHAQGIIYRDLKLENLLLDGDGHIKITDFGLCKEGITFGETTDTFCGTPEYLAPEIVEGNGYGRAADWWSFGAVLYELITGQIPFDSSDPQLLFEMILYDEVHYPSSLSQDARSLLQGLLTKNPEFRLGGGERDAEDIKEHAFFRSVSWEELLAKRIAPPFKPEVASGTDVRYFDPQFTKENVSLTPVGFLKLNRTKMPHFPEFSYSENGRQQG